MRLRLSPLLALCALVLAGPVLAQDVDEDRESEEEAAPAQPVIEPTIPAHLDADASELVGATNAFSLDLLRGLGKRDSNLIVSPASVSAAMGFAYRGAEGETAAQLQRVMNYPFDPVRNLKAGGAVMDTMSFTATGRDLRTANALWLQEGMPFEADFERDMATYAKAGIGRADFKADPEAARKRINGWVEDATNRNIAELLKKGIITDETRAVLVNAIWFKADWRKPFAKAETRIEPFTAIDGTPVPTPLMHQRDHFAVLKRGGVSAIQLPYKGGEVALVAFLPDNHDGLPAFEEKLTAKALGKWFTDLDKADPRDTILTLPKLKLRWGTDLVETLKSMGAPLPFTDDADFDGMAHLPYPGGDPFEVGLKIAHVIHEATVDINETGSEASAATAVVMGVIVTGAYRGPPPPPPFVFRADKPVLFALRDLRTGLVLFLGRYVRPEEEAGS